MQGAPAREAGNGPAAWLTFFMLFTLALSPCTPLLVPEAKFSVDEPRLSWYCRPPPAGGAGVRAMPDALQQRWRACPGQLTIPRDAQAARGGGEQCGRNRVECGRRAAPGWAAMPAAVQCGRSLESRRPPARMMGKAGLAAAVASSVTCIAQHSAGW